MEASNSVESLLANTAALFDNIYHFECFDHELSGKSHRGSSIDHQDLMERREDFVRELRSTISSWVYSKPKFKKILDAEIEARGGDFQNAFSYLQEVVRDKFRPGYPQGQFGELILFNFIQHFFRAVPVLRKMPLTTNPNVERHGADAIHYRSDAERHVVYLGEAKTYSAQYKFTSAVDDAIASVVKAHEGFHKEISLYVNEDFIEGWLLEIATKLKRNKLDGVEFELVCVVCYEETDSKSEASRDLIREAIKKAVDRRLISYKAKVGNEYIQQLKRLHLILLPIWNLEGLLKDFSK